MNGRKSGLKFVGQSVVAGLALAFVLVSLRPDWIRPATGSGGMDFAAAVAASTPAVANVFTEREGRAPGALGSAVVIDSKGYLITNFHVVDDASDVKIQLADGRITTAEVVGEDPDTELALLHIDLSDLPSIRLGRSDNLAVGEVVFAIGNAYGLSQSVTMGIVSATGRGQLGFTTYEDFIQTDAAINAGNSGGALINARGELIGINTAVFSSRTRTRTPPEGIGFAIPINLVRGVMAQLIEHGHVIRGYLGIIGIRELAPGDVAPLGIEGGAITMGDVEGPAAAAGMQPGDVLTHFAGERLYTAQRALNLIAATPPGEKVPVRYVRADGSVVETTVVLDEREPYSGS
jgi:S1-C subfamily serine protease